MSYLWVKAFHLAAVLVLVGGLVALSVVVMALRAMSPAALLPHEKRVGTALLKWDRRVTAPALVAVWVLGFALASWGSWFGTSWLSAKLVLVVAMSAAHGWLSGMLRRRLYGSAVNEPSWMVAVPGLLLGSFVCVAVLVTLKP